MGNPFFGAIAGGIDSAVRELGGEGSSATIVSGDYDLARQYSGRIGCRRGFRCPERRSDRGDRAALLHRDIGRTDRHSRRRKVDGRGPDDLQFRPALCGYRQRLDPGHPLACGDRAGGGSCVVVRAAAHGVRPLRLRDRRQCRGGAAGGDQGRACPGFRLRAVRPSRRARGCHGLATAAPST